MSRYHLHARLFEGTLAHPVRDVRRNIAADDLAQAQRLARSSVAEDCTVWIYDRGHVPLVAGASDYRTVLRFDADGGLEDFR